MARRPAMRVTERQPHFHPTPGPQDGRGNCPSCADYDPAKYGWRKDG